MSGVFFLKVPDLLFHTLFLFAQLKTSSVKIDFRFVIVAKRSLRLSLPLIGTEAKGTQTEAPELTSTNNILCLKTCC